MLHKKCWYLFFPDTAIFVVCTSARARFLGSEMIHYFGELPGSIFFFPDGAKKYRYMEYALYGGNLTRPDQALSSRYRERSLPVNVFLLTCWKSECCMRRPLSGDLFPSRWAPGSRGRYVVLLPVEDLQRYMRVAVGCRQINHRCGRVADPGAYL